MRNSHARSHLTTPFERARQRDFVGVLEVAAHRQTARQTRHLDVERREQAAYEAEQGAFLRVPADAEIVEKTVTYTEEEGCTIAVVCVVTEESIGMERELPHGGDE